MITRQLFSKHLPTKRSLNSPTFQHAHQLFVKMPQPNFPQIHHSMLNFLHQNLPFQALEIFHKQIQLLGVTHVDEVSTALAIKACRGDPKLGSQIHGFALASGLDSFLSVSNSLINMYAKSGQLDRAFVVFDSLVNPDTVSWNTLLSGVENGRNALTFACQMNCLNVPFDAVTYTTALAHCADCEEFVFGSQLHSLVVKNGMQSEGFIANALLTLYAKWEHITEAEQVFDEMSCRDLVSWNAMLSGYSQEGSYEKESISTFVEMVRLGLNLDHVSFTSAVSACGHAKNLGFGMQIHALAVKRAYSSHESVCNVLISTYSKCGKVEDAKSVFNGMVNRNRNVVSWTTMISISENRALTLFNEMRRDEVYPNEVTFVGLIHAICEHFSLKEGETVHGLCIKSSFFNKLVVANSFITMYARFESITNAIKAFEEIENKVIVSWNAMISGFAQNKMFEHALKTFSIMDSMPNDYTFGSVLSAVASSESVSLGYGQSCHAYLFKLGLNDNPIVSGALLDMYAKRGSITESRKVFDEIENKNQVAWTAIISAHSRHGDYESVMKLYEDVKTQSFFEPDSITFLSVLTACGRRGMVEKGKEVFESMVECYKLEPTPEHYSCMVDMYGRAGRLTEAEEFLGRIPGRVGLPVLQSLLGSCKVHGDINMGKRVSDALLRMEPRESGSYVLMSNLYAERADWEEVAKIRKGMRERNVRKVVGLSWVDVCNVGESVHAFSSDDSSHPRTDEIYRMARFLGAEMKGVKIDEVIEQVKVL